MFPLRSNGNIQTLTSPLASVPEIKNFFAENGYYVARSVYSQDQLNELEADFDKIVKQVTKGGAGDDFVWQGAAIEKMQATQTRLVHTKNVQNYSARWFHAVQNPQFLDVAEAILGPDIVLHHSKLFQKPQGKGAPFPMHQDWEYFPTILDTMIAGVIHVSEATDDMGCFRVYPGSHKLGRQHGMMGQEKTLDAMNNKLIQYPLEKGVVLEAEPGDVVYFHYFTLHGSKQNFSKKIRKTVLVQMHSGNDSVEPGNLHPNARLTLRGWNSQLNYAIAETA